MCAAAASCVFGRAHVAAIENGSLQHDTTLVQSGKGKYRPDYVSTGRSKRRPCQRVNSCHTANRCTQPALINIPTRRTSVLDLKTQLAASSCKRGCVASYLEIEHYRRNKQHRCRHRNHANQVQHYAHSNHLRDADHARTEHNRIRRCRNRHHERQ